MKEIIAKRQVQEKFKCENAWSVKVIEWITKKQKKERNYIVHNDFELKLIFSVEYWKEAQSERGIAQIKFNSINRFVLKRKEIFKIEAHRHDLNIF